MAPERDLYGTDETLLSSKLREGLEALYDLFEQAPVLGSLIDPRSVAGDLYRAGFDDLSALLEPILEAEADGDETREHAVAAQGMARAAELLDFRPSVDFRTCLENFVRWYFEHPDLAELVRKWRTGS